MKEKFSKLAKDVGNTLQEQLLAHTKNLGAAVLDEKSGTKIPSRREKAARRKMKGADFSIPGNEQEIVEKPQLTTPVAEKESSVSHPDAAEPLTDISEENETLKIGDTFKEGRWTYKVENIAENGDVTYRHKGNLPTVTAEKFKEIVKGLEKKEPKKVKGEEELRKSDIEPEEKPVDLLDIVGKNIEALKKSKGECLARLEKKYKESQLKNKISSFLLGSFYVQLPGKKSVELSKLNLGQFGDKWSKDEKDALLMIKEAYDVAQNDIKNTYDRYQKMRKEAWTDSVGKKIEEKEKNAEEIGALKKEFDEKYGKYIGEKRASRGEHDPKYFMLVGFDADKGTAIGEFLDIRRNEDGKPQDFKDRKNNIDLGHLDDLLKKYSKPYDEVSEIKKKNSKREVVGKLTEEEFEKYKDYTNKRLYENPDLNGKWIEIKDQFDSDKGVKYVCGTRNGLARTILNTMTVESKAELDSLVKKFQYIEEEKKDVREKKEPATEPEEQPSWVLSQQEIDALLKGIQEGEEKKRKIISSEELEKIAFIAKNLLDKMRVKAEEISYGQGKRREAILRNILGDYLEDKLKESYKELKKDEAENLTENILNKLFS